MHISPARALFVPIVLAMTLPLTACFLLPDGPAPVYSSAAPIAEPTAEQTVTPAEDIVAGTLVNCTYEALSALLPQGAGDPADVRTIREIGAAEFLPTSLSGVLYNGCVYEVTSVEKDGRTNVYQGALVPGGFDVYDSIDTVLLSHGYENEANPSIDGSNNGENHATYGEYYTPELDYVVVWSSKSDQFNWDIFNTPGFNFLGGEFVQLMSVDI